MNERIQELAREAGLDDPDFPIEDWDNVPLAKFAELIVRECARDPESAYQRGYLDGIGRECPHCKDYKVMYLKVRDELAAAQQITQRQTVNAMTSNFCPRCGKRRGGDVNYIHTCTPPRGLEMT